jgi:uncharacterized RDD family membrane protein YckC
MIERDDLKSDTEIKIDRRRRSRAALFGKRAKDGAAVARRRVRAAFGVARLVTKAGLARVGAGAKAARKMKCPACGSRVAKETKFCAICGADLSAASKATSAIKPRPEAAVKKPVLLQRVAAQLIDRLLSLPFLALVYPDWVWVVGAFHLICEMWSGRSPGKLICRMRVVDAGSLKVCGPVRGLLRRVGVALGQVAYCRWEWISFAIAYDLLSFLVVWRNGAGQRIEDKLLGTRVIGEGRYRKLERECAECGAKVSARARFCPHCGKKPTGKV